MKPAIKIYGITARAPRLTPMAIWMALRYLGLPLIGALLVLDILIWALGLAIWDVCIGVWCWL